MIYDVDRRDPLRGLAPRDMVEDQLQADELCEHGVT